MPGSIAKMLQRIIGNFYIFYHNNARQDKESLNSQYFNIIPIM